MPFEDHASICLQVGGFNDHLMFAVREPALAEGVQQFWRDPHGARAIFAHAAGILRDERAEKCHCGNGEVPDP